MDWPNGQERRAWLDRQGERLNNALSYYLGPAAAPVNALANVGAMLSPGADMMDMANSSRDLMASETPGNALANAGWLGAATLGMALPGSVGQLRGAADDAVEGIRAYHGSPHDFDAFDLSKIGTGEGAQAYGHGLYFAKAEDVAKRYRDALANPPNSGPQSIANYWVQEAKGDAAEAKRMIAESANNWRSSPMFESDPAIKKMVSDLEEAVGMVDSAAPKAGHMYEVNIRANPDDFLDWDKPLSEQSEKIRKAAADLAARDEVFDAWTQNGTPIKGGMIYDRMSGSGGMRRGNIAGRSNASVALREAGIPGIRYLDQGSRGAGEGTSNYVVFDPALIEIMRKYGLAGAGVGLGAMGMNALADPNAQERY